MELSPKQEILDQFLSELRELRAKEKDLVELDKAEYDLASSYLSKFPFLKDFDCSGRGLPAHVAKSAALALSHTTKYGHLFK
jgi:hypothetical protein